MIGEMSETMNDRGMKRWARIVMLALSVLAATGCGRAVISTEVRADGSFSRAIRLSANKPGSMGPTIAEVFVPPSGAGWNSKETALAGEDRVTLLAERSFKADESSSGDVVLLGGPKTRLVPWLRNEARVRRLGPTRLEYTETFHWLGKPESLDDPMDPKERAELAKIVGSEAVVDELRHDLVKKVMQVFMGPPNPLFSQLITHPELVEARVRRDMGREIERVLSERFGDRLTPDQRTIAARRFLEAVMSKVEATRDKTEHKTSGGEKDADPSMVSLTVTVKLPGKLVECNGLRDDVNGTVTWGMFATAAATGDVTLRAVCDTTPKP